MCFDGVNVLWVGAFAFVIDWEFELACFLFADACFFDFVAAESFACFLFAVWSVYGCFYVVHLT